MKDSEKTFVNLVGCLPAAWRLLVSLPMWAAILYGILGSLPALPQWVHIVFWIFVPVSAIGLILNAICTAFKEAVKD
jgi:Ca2+/Na+ antiporter